MQQASGCMALVTGANRGIGRGLVEALLERGARHVYAAARSPATLAPVLDRNGGGALVQILAVGALACFPQVGTYCASKFATRAMTQGVRLELHGQGTFVMAVYSGAVETDMSRNTPREKISALDHGREVLAALERGETEVCPDFKARAIRDALAADAAAFERSLLTRLS